MAEETVAPVPDIYADPLEPNVIEAPDPFVGKTITVEGQVNEVLAPQAFELAQVGGGERAILVIHNKAADAVEGRPVRVRGEVGEFDLVTVEQELGTDFDDVEFGVWDGRKFIMAEVVAAAKTSPSP